MDLNQKQKTLWQEELLKYEKRKHKAPPMENIPKRTHSLVKQKEFQFNTILDSFKDQQADEVYRSKIFQKPTKNPTPKTDIFHPKDEFQLKPKRIISHSHKVPFNILNNQLAKENHPVLPKKQ